MERSATFKSDEGIKLYIRNDYTCEETKTWKDADDNTYCTVKIGNHKKDIFISGKKTDRQFLFAIPLIYKANDKNAKILGGLTVDVDCKSEGVPHTPDELYNLCHELSALGDRIINTYFLPKKI